MVSKSSIRPWSRAGLEHEQDSTCALSRLVCEESEYVMSNDQLCLTTAIREILERPYHEAVGLT